MDCSPPGFPVLEVSQARILEWVAIPSSRGSSRPRGQTCVSCISCIDRCVLCRWAPRHALNTCTTCSVSYSLGILLCSSKGISSVQFSRSVVSNSLWPHESQHARPPCPSPTPGVYSDSCPLSRWCHPTISSSVIPFSSCLQSFPASGSFPMSQLFSWGGQSTGVSALASVLPVKTQDWSPLGWTGWISLQSKGLSGVFSNTTVQKHQLFGTQLNSPTLKS